MFNLTTRTRKMIHVGMTLAFGAALFLSAPAGAADDPENTPPPPPAHDYTEPPTNDYTEPKPPETDYDYKCDEYKQVYAQTDYSAYPHQHLDVVCEEGYRAISCEAAIHGKDDYGYNMYFVALNEAHPETFKKSSHGDYEHTSSNPTYYGCHFRANNFLAYFTTSYQPQYTYDFEWQLKGYATCVPKECVYVEQTHEYYGEWLDPVEY